MIDSSEQWLLSTLHHANRNDEDTYRLYLTLRRYIYDTRDFVGMIEQITPTELRFKPTTDLADGAFEQIGFPGISKNWKFWVAYVQEHICI